MTTTTAATMNVWIADGSPQRCLWTWAGTADTEEQALEMIRQAAVDALTEEIDRTRAEMAADTEGRTALEVIYDATLNLLDEVLTDGDGDIAAAAAETIDRDEAQDLINAIMPAELDAEGLTEGDDTTVGTVSLSDNWAGIVERADR